MIGADMRLILRAGSRAGTRPAPVRRPRASSCTDPRSPPVSLVRNDEVMVARRPERDVAVPDVVFELAGRRAVRAVWRNELDGLTFKLGTGSDSCFVKWAPAGSELDLAGEAARMVWVQPFSVVPEVIAIGHDDSGSWLATTPLLGDSAVADQWKQEPA